MKFSNCKFFWREICLVLTAFFVFAGMDPSCWAQMPARLLLRPENGTIQMGQSMTVKVEFLDRSFRGAGNDHSRTISLRVRGIGNRPGQVELNPSQLSIAAGSVGEVKLVPRSAGTVEVIATSDGLTPARVVLTVVRTGGRLFSIIPPAYAQNPMRVEILPKDNVAIPANGVSRAVIYVALDRQLGSGEQLLIRVQTVPGCRVSYEGETTVGFTQLTIGPGNARSKEIQISSTHPGTVQVSARVVPPGAGTQDSMTIGFVSPQASKIIFDDQPTEIDSNLSHVPITVRIADQDLQPVLAPHRTYNIRFEPLSDTEIIHFEPDIVQITSAHPSMQSLLRLDSAPASGNITFRATDQAGNLEASQKTITLNSYLHSVVLSGPDQLRRGKNGTIKIQLADSNGTIRRADWARTIELYSSDGSFRNSKIVIPQGAESAEATYKAPGAVATVTVTGSSAALVKNSITIKIVTPMILLLLFSGIGGLIGGFFKLTKQKIQQFLPAKLDGAWELGLVVNTGSSLALGIIGYLAIRLGILSVVSISPVIDTRSAAFVVGTAGGFAGVHVLEILVDRLFGKPVEKAEEAVAGKH